MKKQMKDSQFWLAVAIVFVSTLLSFRTLVVEANDIITPPPGEVYIHVKEIGYTDDGKYLENLGYGTTVFLKKDDTYEVRAKDIAGWKLKRVSISYADGTEKELSVEDGIIRFGYEDFADKPTSIQGPDTFIELSELFYGYLVVCEYVESDATYVYVSSEGIDPTNDFIGGELDTGENVFIEQGDSYQLKEPKDFLGWVFDRAYIQHSDGRKEEVSLGQTISLDQLQASPKRSIGPKRVVDGQLVMREGYSLVYQYIPVEETIPVLRFYNSVTQQHVYVRHASEIARLQAAGWRREGTAWRSWPTSDLSEVRHRLVGEKDGTVLGPVFYPIYRLWNTKTGERVLTSHWTEIRHLIARGWKNEGIAFFSRSSGQPVYRLRHQKTGRYLFTSGQGEVAKLIATGHWKNEGIAFFSRP